MGVGGERGRRRRRVGADTQSANNEPVLPQQRRLISPGATMGGARPKALIDISGDQWVIKFSDGDPADTPLQGDWSLTLGLQILVKKPLDHLVAVTTVVLTHESVLGARIDHHVERLPQILQPAK